MYKYIDENTIEPAPKVIMDEEKVYANPLPETLLAHGYKELAETPKPEKNGFYYTLSYADDGDVIRQVWTEHEITASEPEETQEQESEPVVEPIAEEPENVVEE